MDGESKGSSSSSSRRRRKRTWEESLYWDRFTPVFKVDLHPNFRSFLEIPRYFSENVKGTLPEKVTLKGPSPDETSVWQVQLTTRNNTTILHGDGWKRFVVSLSLRENDTLVFKYKNKSYFKVRIIDGYTSCERESSHFIRNHHEPEIFDGEKLIKRSKVGERNISQILWKEYHRQVKGVDDPQQANALFEVKTKKAKERAKALKDSSERSFFVQLPGSSVGAPFRLNIPREWWQSVIKSNREVQMRLWLKGKDEYQSQRCRCVYYSGKGARLTTGWKAFVQANDLQQGDCCVFRLAQSWQKGEDVCFEVEIIRASEDEFAQRDSGLDMVD